MGGITVRSLNAIWVSAFAGLVVSLGCVGPPLTSAELKAAECGAYPKDYQQIVKQSFQRSLKDPYSARYRFAKGPYRAYLRKAPVTGGGPSSYGYISEVWVNSKNGFGAYTGERLYRAFIREGTVVAYVGPNQWFPEDWYR